MQDHGYRIIPVNPTYHRSARASDATRTSRPSPSRSTSSIAFASRRRWCRSRAMRWRSAPRCCGCSSAFATTKRRASRSTAASTSCMDRCVKIEHARHDGRPQLGRASTPASSRHAGPPRRIAAHARPRLRLRHAVPARGPDPRRGDRRARAADLPDHVVRVRQRRPRREPLQPADVRQRLLAHLESRPSPRSRSASPRSKAGRAALAAATGMAAQMVALLTLARARRPHRRVAHALRRHATRSSR